MMLTPLVLFEASLRMQLVPSRSEHSGDVLPRKLTHCSLSSARSSSMAALACAHMLHVMHHEHHDGQRRRSNAAHQHGLLHSSVPLAAHFGACNNCQHTQSTQKHSSTTTSKRVVPALCLILPTLFCECSARAVQLHLELLCHRLA